MNYCYNCGNRLSTHSEKFCSNCGKNLDERLIMTNENNAEGKGSIYIHGNQGDIIGVGFTGSNNIIGKNISVGNNAIKLNKKELDKVPVIEYSDALKNFSESVTL
jgi:hypothetical protein